MGPWAAATIEYLQSFDFELEYEAPVKFPAPPETPETSLLPDGMVAVPPVRGHTLEGANRLIVAAGLKQDAETAYLSGGVWAPGRVMASSPETGEVVAVGSSIQLSVTGDWWSKPDFTGI